MPNQQNISIESDIKLETLQYAMSRLDKIISDADNKANFLLCFSIVILGSMIFISHDIGSSNIFYKLLPTLTFLSFSLSSLFSFIAIFPRYSKYKSKLKNVPKESVFYFMDIYKLVEFEGVFTNGETLLLDYLNQMQQLSCIIRKKMKNIKISVVFTGLGVLFAVVVYILTFYTATNESGGESDSLPNVP